MAALDKSSKADLEREDRLVGALEKLAGETRRTLEEIRLASRLSHLNDDQTTRIFFQDVAVHVALSVADVDHFQRRVLELRTPHDPDLLTQLIDLVPSLEGRTILDIGGFTGMLGFLLREFLKPSALHVFEPQKVLADGLKAAVKLNTSKECPIHFHPDIIDEKGAEMVLGTQPPARLHQTRYLRREGGPLKAKAIDSLKCGTVGMMVLDFENDKVGALRGALKTIERDKPFILVDRNSRDEADILKLLEPFEYTVTGMSRTYHLYIPSA